MDFDHTDSSSVEYASENNIIKVNFETLEIPSQIDGKDVVKISFVNNYSSELDTDWRITIQGIKKIVYPNTLQVLGSTDVLFEDLTEVSLPNSLLEIQNDAFLCCISLKNITIPSSVEIIKGTPFRGCEDLTINVEGKTSKEDFHEISDYWNHLGHYIGYAQVNFLGE